MKKIRNYLPVILIFIFFLLLGSGIGVGVLFFKDQVSGTSTSISSIREKIPFLAANPQDNSNSGLPISETISPASASSLTPTPTSGVDIDFQILDTNDPKIKEFVSNGLGISFDYLSEQRIGPISAKIMGNNKICLYFDKNDTDCLIGQLIEIYKKEKTDSLEQAIQKQFLKEYPENNCLAKLKNINASYPTNFQTAVISPASNNIECPRTFNNKNVISFFLMDENYTEKFLFIKVSQIGVLFEKPNAKDFKLVNNFLKFF